MSDSEDEERSIIAWLFEAIFGRTEASEDDIGDAIHRLGEVKQRRTKERD
jgi:hypothetical protein